MTQYVPVRLDDDTVKELDRRAATEKNRSVVIRRALKIYLSGQEQLDRTAVLELTKAVTDFRADMGRVGGNLNQLAYYFNLHDTIQPHELAGEHRELQRQFKALMTLIKRLHGLLAER